MNILFLSLCKLDSIDEPGIYTDLLREFIKNDHIVYIISPTDKKPDETDMFCSNGNVKTIHTFTGKITKTNVVEKGLNTVLIEKRLIQTIKRKLSGVSFDLVLYPTPPITFAGVVSYVKTRDHAKTYLLLKDIFPQNAVDIGILSKSGIKGLLYKYFRRIEKKLYTVSDRIGCMSLANVDYLLKHDPEILPEKVEVCPNCIEVRDLSLTTEEKIHMREKYALPTDKIVFVYGGNLGKPQGIPFVIECLKLQLNNPDAYFLIVGNGTEYGKLKCFFEEARPKNMRLMSSIPKDDYDRMIAACDVGMIFLDHRFTIPNFPSRLLSYMQAKLPIIACTDPNTDVGKVVVDGDFGWWCESDDLRAFDNIVVSASVPDLRQKGENAAKFLRVNYSVKSAYERIMGCLNNAQK